MHSQTSILKKGVKRVCNHHCSIEWGNIPSNPASKFTEESYDKIASNSAYMSNIKAHSNAKRGLLVSADGLMIGENGTIFNLQHYTFLENDSNNKKTVHPALWKHAKLNMNVGLYRVNNIEQNEQDDTSAKYSTGKFMASAGDVFQVRGYDLANMTLVRGRTGWIIMDVLTCNETAKAAFDFIKSHLKLYCGNHDIKCVFYSHSHVDHYGGIAGIIKEEDVVREHEIGKSIGKKATEIIAPEGFMHFAVSENIFAGNAMNSRAAYMYGAFLRRDPQGQVDNGLGKATAIGTNSLIAPSKEIGFKDLESGKRYVNCVIDGIVFQCQITPGTEAPAEMNIYMPDYKVLFIAENCTGTLHNLYTLRGAEVRDSMAWADYLDETITTFPNVETICSSHNWPHFGNKNCLQYLGLQRDVYRYMTNATLNLINKGYTIDEVGRMLESNIPDNIHNEWCNHGFYGTFNHNAKAIYQKYLGWYDSNPSNLNKMMPEDTATRYVQCMDGAENVVDMAKRAYDSGEYAWVAELLNRVIFARLATEEEIHRNEAKLLCADALEQLGYQSESGPWRNEYLTAAGVLRKNIIIPEGAKFTINETTLNAMDMGMVMQYLAIMLNGMAAQVYVLNANVEFIDTGEIGRMWIGNGVLNFRKMSGQDFRKLPAADLSVSGSKLGFFQAFTEMNETAFCNLSICGIGAISNYAAKYKLKGLWLYLEQFTRNFPIVTPKIKPTALILT